MHSSFNCCPFLCTMLYERLSRNPTPRRWDWIRNNCSKVYANVCIPTKGVLMSFVVAETMQMTLGDCFGISNHSFWTKLWSFSTEIIWDIYIEASWQQAMINLGRGQNDPCMAHNSKKVQKGGTYWGRVTWLGRQIKSTVCEWHVVKQFWSQGLWRSERPWDNPHNGTTKFASW